MVSFLDNIVCISVCFYVINSISSDVLILATKLVKISRRGEISVVRQNSVNSVVVDARTPCWSQSLFNVWVDLMHHKYERIAPPSPYAGVYRPNSVSRNALWDFVDAHR